MKNSELFLDLYKRLEDELEKKYVHAKRRYSSVVFEFTKDPDSEPIREQLNVCREIRNLLTHSANVGNLPVVEPSDPILESINDVLQYASKPPLAIEFATRYDQIIKATLDQKVLRLMEVMKKKGYSHIPVLKDGNFFGIFSMSTVFSYILSSGATIVPDTTIRDLGLHISVQEHTENYAFIAKTATYILARTKFQKVKGRNKRISAVFITETGNCNEKLLAMLTPWDVIGE